ncbi:hypothetical protein [Streptomyces candidus]|uniref:Uncharacterized protein n=1 Tax=Streptomyces candidus TaxID=67283 RepID=A0A7X0HD01_9ACTN|nr:hypothetical protein [Streptomyces candidus]MBB6435385.1 hypothetical protein [Streptomyces candidus]
MLDTTPLLTALERLTDRLRALPESRLRRGAAAEALALAREFALRAQRIEFPGRQPAELRDAGVFAVADQLAVAGRDLALVIGTAPSGSLDEAVALVEAVEKRL